ncbi:MAG: Hsp20/alpha crystallin family protein [Thermoguttaceae bacterium]
MAEETKIAKAPADEVRRAEQTRSGVCYRPLVDILETDEELTVLADVPGASPEGIDVDFENGTLTIHARVAPRDEGADFLVREYGVGDYYRTFEVNETIDPDKISAQYADGVLSVRLPKAEAAKPRKITVKT